MTYLDSRCKSLPLLSNTENQFVVEDLEDNILIQGAHKHLESSNQLEETLIKIDLSEV